MILSIPQQIEGKEARITTSKQQIAKLPPALVEADDLAIEHCIVHIRERFEYRLGQNGEGCERVSIARDQVAASGSDAGQRAEAVVLQFKELFRVIEGMALLEQRHGLEGNRHLLCLYNNSGMDEEKAKA
jgi:hypothetical protein